MTATAKESKNVERAAQKRAMQFVLLLGVISLLADATYEGGRSIAGPYLAVLGASATTVGLVAGFGELVGYGLRLVSGYVSDRTGKYWSITFLGYAVNLVAVPLLALAGHWEIAALLMVLERTGKAIRTPARDAMLSHATAEVGRGWGFGLHEAMDQIGAMLGPLIVAAVFYIRGSYRAGFAVLLAPALLALGVLVVARRRYPRPRDLEPTATQVTTRGFQRRFWLYLAAVALIAAGYADFPLIAFHLQAVSSVRAVWIPVFYAVAMGVDALAALLFGRLFDRTGTSATAVAAVLSAPFAIFAFARGFVPALVGVVLWGVGMGAQESIMRAAVADMVPADRRGAAYGVFNAGYGVAWFAGSALMGALYDVSIPALMTFSVLAQLASLPLLLTARKKAE